MNRYFYDLHIHSCLSPCADDDMTPNNIAGMAALKGLNIIALTDHNSCKNCPAFFEACKRYGIIPVAGMELSTAEDIHLVCLFPELESAMTFDREIEGHLVKIKKFIVNLEQKTNKLTETDEERRVLCALTQKQKEALKQIEAKERESKKHSRDGGSR